KIGGSWDEYIDYVSDITKADNITSNTGLSQRFLMYDPDLSYYGNPQLRWRFGLKTLVDFPQDKYPSHNDSPGLAGAPEEPMGAVANAVQESLNIIESLESNDLVGTAAYSTQGYGPAQKPSALSWLTDDLNLLRDQVATLQAGMWSTNTNIAQGIDRGAEVLLQSPRGRDNAAKIMVLLTDGNANQTRSEPSQYLPYDRRPAEDTLDAARDAHLAHPQRIRIYCVSVGVDSDQELMEQVAQIGQGEHFHAGGDVESYREQLQQIFRDLGGRRSVVLME
ncbi:MAG TPA: VWA domain-containing protein, partial [Phycisphaerae bacterium]|nr:VWA domain-containing protein [Phycisphaerae bacterium]HXK85194.1 VWA domain-containing protein [Phycisphaerae bacterium]